MTKLAASIMVHDLEQARADAARAAEFGAELVEFRIDTFAGQNGQITALIERSPLPCIMTCRPVWEGGRYLGDDAERLRRFTQAMAGVRQPAYLDLELKAYQTSPLLRDGIAQLLASTDRPPSTGLILSAHDFEQRPSALYQQLEAMAAAPDCRVIKLAWQARSLRDNLEAFELLSQQYKPAIALCMGPFGLPSRVLAKKFGALLTFAALDHEHATAPGQPTLAELKSLYRWDQLNRDTAVFGVIGWPIGQSRSPAIHNAGFSATNFNGVYLPLPIPPEYEHFKATVITWLDHAPLHFGGASVTIPHKQNLLRFVKEMGGSIEPLAARIGAANTLTRRADGSLHASNTDYAAALDAVCDGMNIARSDLLGRGVAVIGAGGAARAIVAGFAQYGAKVTVYNRTLDRAEQLAEAFGQPHNGSPRGSVAAAPMSKLNEARCDVLINCTPIGMHPDVEQTPIASAAMKRLGGPGVVVFDTIYNPAETRLLREAKAAGCVTISGIEMFVRQAAAQFELWTDQPAPLDVFRARMADM